MKKQPGEIEQASFAIIREELRRRGLVPDDGNAAVVLRCIHASADFDYAENLRFSPGVVQHALEALKAGAAIVTDTNMARAGISRVGLQKLGGDVICLMADPSIAEVAKARGTTRAAAAMEVAAQQFPTAIYAVGNAPTALFTLSDCMDRGFRPSLVVAAPVGFVNVVDHDFHDGVNINTVLVVSDDSFFGAIEDEAFALGIGTQFGDVVETKHHVL